MPRVENYEIFEIFNNFEILENDFKVPEYKSHVEWLRFNFLRAAHREKYWINHDVKISKQGALGRFVRSVLDEKVRLGTKRHSGAKEDKLSQKALLNQFNQVEGKNIDPSAFNKFLNGKPTGAQNWYSIVPSLLTELLLFGDNSSSMLRSSTLNEITSLFGENEECFFNPLFRDRYAVSTVTECVTELLYVAHCSANGARCRLIRTSGRDRFLQVNTPLDALTKTGEATLECLASGVECYFLFPKFSGNNRAKSSAIFFEETAVKCKDQNEELIYMLEIPLGYSFSSSKSEGRWPQEFLSKLFRWSGFEIKHTNEEIERLLIVNRKAKHGLNPFIPDKSETELFFEWAELVIKEQISHKVEEAINLH